MRRRLVILLTLCLLAVPLAAGLISHPTPAEAVPRVTADFDGDGKTDPAIYRPETGTWHVKQSSGGEFGAQFGAPPDIPVSGDYNGDGDTEMAVYRPSTGVWYVQGGMLTAQFGDKNDTPVPGDYDGNGTTDVAVFRPSTGTWYVRNGPVVQYGVTSDIPVPGDYNGDGKTDIAVYRPSSGTWYVRGGSPEATRYGDRSGGTSNSVNTGAADRPIPADYNGDGKTDMAVYRSYLGLWFVRGGLPEVTAYGVPTDYPAPGDYNGDGRADIAVFRHSQGTWFVRPSTGPAIIHNWGVATDINAVTPASITHDFDQPFGDTGLVGVPSLSEDGRYVAFTSFASNLAPGDTNVHFDWGNSNLVDYPNPGGGLDVFVKDRRSGVTTMVSAGATDATTSSDPSITGDGRYVAFWSNASNLSPGDNDVFPDVFVRDVATGTTTLVSRSSSGAKGNGLSGSPSISTDGRYVAFASAADNLVSGDTNGTGDVFVRDLVAGSTERVSVSNSPGIYPNDSSWYPSISSDGRYVAFSSSANNMLTVDTNGTMEDTFVRDRLAKTTTLVSRNSAGQQADSWSGRPTISGDGRFITFESPATNLTDQTLSGRGVFIRDIATGITRLIAPLYAQASAQISRDGSRVVFDTLEKLGPGDTNTWSDVYEYNVALGYVRVHISVDDYTHQTANAPSGSPAISGDGQVAAFGSFATNFGNDTSDYANLYVHDWLPEMGPIAAAEGGSPGDCTLGPPAQVSSVTSQEPQLSPPPTAPLDKDTFPAGGQLGLLALAALLLALVGRKSRRSLLIVVALLAVAAPVATTAQNASAACSVVLAPSGGVPGPVVAIQQGDQADVIAEEAAVDSNHLDGQFCVSDWSGYPEGQQGIAADGSGAAKTVGRPGPMRVLKKGSPEYIQARKSADAANKALHRLHPEWRAQGMQIHEIQPVKFGGSPIDPANKVVLLQTTHQLFTTWYGSLQRNIERSC